MRVEIFTMGGIVRDMPDRAARNLIAQGQAAEVGEDGAEKVAKKAVKKDRKAARRLKNKMKDTGANK